MGLTSLVYPVVRGMSRAWSRLAKRLETKCRPLEMEHGLRRIPGRRSQLRTRWAKGADLQGKTISRPWQTKNVAMNSSSYPSMSTGALDAGWARKRSKKFLCSNLDLILNFQHSTLSEKIKLLTKEACQFTWHITLNLRCISSSIYVRCRTYQLAEISYRSFILT